MFFDYKSFIGMLIMEKARENKKGRSERTGLLASLLIRFAGTDPKHTSNGEFGIVTIVPGCDGVAGNSSPIMSLPMLMSIPCKEHKSFFGRSRFLLGPPVSGGWLPTFFSILSKRTYFKSTLILRLLSLGFG